MSIRDVIEAPFREKVATSTVGIGNFTAVVRTNESYSRSATIPTVFLEDGTHINDHIILEPLVLTISGDVSDIHVAPSTFADRIDDIQSTIGSVDAYIPPKTQQQLSKISGIANDINDAITALDNAVDKAQSLLGGLRSGTDVEKSNQEAFLDAMDSLAEGKKLFSIDMPFRTYENMYMTSFDATYDNIADSTGFTIVATQFRFAETAITRINTSPASGTDGSVDSLVDKSTQEPEQSEETTTSLLGFILG